MISQYGQLTENRTIQVCAKIVFSLHTARIENPYTPQTYSSASNFHEYHSDTPRHPSDSSQTPPDIPREHEMPTDNNRCQETLPDFLKQHLSVSWGLWRCLLASVDICWHVMFHRDAVGLSGECLEGVWGKLSGIHGNRRPTNVFGGYMGSQSLQYGVKTLFWHSSEWYGFLSTDHTETSKYQNRRISAFQK